MSKKVLDKAKLDMFKANAPGDKPQPAKQKSKPQPATPPKDRPAVERGLRPGETRATIIIKKDTLEKIKAIAYWEPGKNIRTVINSLLEDSLAKYEKEKGKIKPIPEED